MRLARYVAVFGLAMSWSLLAIGQPGGQPYPSKPVHVIVPFTAGSATDILARTFGQKLSELWGQPVIVDNRAGAGGTIGAAVVAKAPADGYTLLMTTIGPAVLRPLIDRKLGYDAVSDFTPIALVASVLLK